MAVLPVYNIIAVPGGTIYLKPEGYKSLTGRTPYQDDKVTLIIPKEDVSRKEWKNDSFYPIGIVGIISEVNTNGYIVVRLRKRVNLDEITVFHDHSIDLVVSKRDDIEDLDAEEAKKKLTALKSEILSFSQDYQWGASMRNYVAGWSSITEIAAAISPWMMNSNEEKYQLLAEDSVSRRTELMEKMIYENLEFFKVQTQAKSAQEEDYQKIYRESAIHKQMDYLQKELDELHPENVSDLRRLELKLDESPMNDSAKKEGRKILNRLKSEGSNSTESGMLMDYLDVLTGLPWKKEPARDIRLEEARKILDADHFGLKKVKKRIIEQIAVMNLKGVQSGSILLFVGAPGTGKTSIGQSIARALGREYTRVSLGGVRDEADIRGHRRTYIGSMPGRIIDGIQKAGVSNPVMVLDEIDKLSTSYNGDPASALLEVLDPEQNHTFTDHYLNVPYDLSDVFFICTANSLDTIPGPLLDRMEVIEFHGYTPLEKMRIARDHLLPKAAKAAGLKDSEISISDEVIDEIISEYTREAGVRGLKKRLDMICRSAAVRLVTKLNEAEKLHISTSIKNTGKNEYKAADADGSTREADSENETGSEDRIDSEATADSKDKDVSETKDKDADESGAGAGAGIEALSEEDRRVEVKAGDLSELMDMNSLHSKKVREKALPGIVTGLAWTQAGGDILYIETMATKGDGKLKITGQLGDVMKESAQIAVSLVKSFFPDKADFFKENDLHIHVPDGATPKDGPSAGITLTTALSSLVSGVDVSPAIAMTGEVSLQGRVNPIGGLPEKLMAAQRSGVKKVFIPMENEQDLKDVPAEVKDALEIIPVQEARQVLKAVGISLPAQDETPELKAALL